jgi:hypothetical protein
MNELVVVVMEAAAFAGAVITLLGLLGWLVVPRFKDWMSALITEQATALTERLDRVEKQVTPNGFSSEDERGVTTADRLVNIERRQTVLAGRIDSLNDNQTAIMTERARDKVFWRAALAQHGITIPIAAHERDGLD